MPKNSRPDIQVLEARVVRLKAQLLEYKDIRTYEITKQRLLKVSAELEECIMIIDEVTRKDGDLDKKLVSLNEPETIWTTEFNDDNEFEDVFSDPSEDVFDLDSSFDYTPKKIVGAYASKLQECSNSQTGIIQVNQFCSLLSSWYQERFMPEIRNPNFYYKASRIHEWIDLLILYAGKSLHEGTFPEFKAYMDDWISTLNTSKDDGWLVPLKVRQIKEEEGAYTKEAILIEKIVKPMLYDKDFYPSELLTVTQIVIHKQKYQEADISIENLIKDCPRLVVTSSFDISKYTGGQ